MYLSHYELLYLFPVPTRRGAFFDGVGLYMYVYDTEINRSTQYKYAYTQWKYAHTRILYIRNYKQTHSLVLTDQGQQSTL